MRPLERAFDAYGRYVAINPWPFIIVPTLITIISTYGFKNFHSQDDIWDIYAPLNGLSRVEEAAMKRFEYASGSHHYRMQILVNRKDGGNLLEKPLLDEILRAHKFVVDNMTFSDGMGGELQYKHMCGIYCNESNAAVLAFLQGMLNLEKEERSGGGGGGMQFSYPNARALQSPVFLGYSIGDLSFDNSTPPIVTEARLILLHYMTDLSLPGGRAVSDSLEHQLRAHFHHASDQSEQLQYQVLSRRRELEEQRAITIMALPFLGLTVLILTSFMIITMIDFPLYRSQHIESLVGVFSPGMALWTSCGLLWWLGYPFSNILTVVPFLVITIGVDDAFLVLAGWRQSTRGASLEQRLGQAVAISGASVTVTSVTDVLCFAIGLVSNMPVVQLFCLYTSVALFIDYFYQMTLFTAVVGLCGKRQIEIDEARKRRGGDRDSETGSVDKSMSEPSSSTGSFKSLVKTKEKLAPRPDPLTVFVTWLHSWPAKLLVVVTFAAHIGASTYLTTQVNTDFDMENLYLRSSPLTDISRRMQDFVLREAFVVNFAVYPIPDFSNATLREEFEEMVKFARVLVEELETLPRFGRGEENTNLWTREFKQAVAFWGDEEEFWAEEDLLKNYREYAMQEKWITKSNDKDGVEHIDGFFFTITYQNMSSFLEVEEMMEDRRNILSKYPQFNVSSHHPMEKVPTESAAAAPSNFIQTGVSAIVLMSILVLLFVMNAEAIISVVISIISICVGTIGYLHLWDVHLDAVSLISTLMSIGFSVDYSAHVCYHYFAHGVEHTGQIHPVPTTLTLAVNGAEKLEKEQNGEERKEEKLKKSIDRIVITLRGVGWPVVQSGISTILGIVPLVFIRAYVVDVFYKTVVLVGILGMYHALLLLPVIFMITSDIKSLFRRCFR